LPILPAAYLTQTTNQLQPAVNASPSLTPVIRFDECFKFEIDRLISEAQVSTMRISLLRYGDSHRTTVSLLLPDPRSGTLHLSIRRVHAEEWKQNQASFNPENEPTM